MQHLLPLHAKNVFVPSLCLQWILPCPCCYQHCHMLLFLLWLVQILLSSSPSFALPPLPCWMATAEAIKLLSLWAGKGTELTACDHTRSSAMPRAHFQRYLCFMNTTVWGWANQTVERKHCYIALMSKSLVGLREAAEWVYGDRGERVWLPLPPWCLPAPWEPARSYFERKGR